MGVNGIYGLSGSGLDVESMVKVGMMSKQKEYDKMKQTYTQNEWKKAEYVDLYGQIQTFNNSTLSQYKMSSSMNARSASSNNDSAVTATANATAPTMTHYVEVGQLASAAYLIGTESLKRIGGETKTVDGETKFVVNEDSVKLADVLFKKLSADSEGVVTYEALSGDPDNLASGDVYNDGDKKALDKKAFSFSIGDGSTEKDENGDEKPALKEISVTYRQLLNGYTFNDLVADVNSKGLNIRASYDSVQDKFSFYNGNSGADNQVILQANNNDGEMALAARFLDALGLKQSENGELTELANIEGNEEFISFANDFEYGGAGLVVSGKNAIAKIDGVVYDKLSANTATVNGVIYKFNSKTSEAVQNEDGTYSVNTLEGQTAATVTVTQDVEKIVDKVKSFVEDYNKVLSKLYEWYDKEPSSNYKPLTEAQKNEMTEEQIEKWEKKAKEGLLYHDKTLGRIIDDVRDAVSENVLGLNGKYKNLFSLGVSTSGTKGQLSVDEDKLRAALAEDPDSVYNIFAKIDTGYTYIDKDGKEVKVSDRASYNGVAQRLGDVLTKGMKSINTVAGTTTEISDDSDLSSLLRDLQTKMSNFQKMMSAFEESLYKKYDAMETSLALLGSQLNYVMNSFGS